MKILINTSKLRSTDMNLLSDDTTTHVHNVHPQHRSSFTCPWNGFVHRWSGVTTSFVDGKGYSTYPYSQQIRLAAGVMADPLTKVALGTGHVIQNLSTGVYGCNLGEVSFSQKQFNTSAYEYLTWNATVRGNVYKWAAPTDDLNAYQHFELLRFTRLLAGAVTVEVLQSNVPVGAFTYEDVAIHLTPQTDFVSIRIASVSTGLPPGWPPYSNQHLYGFSRMFTVNLLPI